MSFSPRTTALATAALLGAAGIPCTGTAQDAASEPPAELPVDLPIDLEWDAPEGCPSRESVLEHVQPLVGSLPPGSTTVEAHGSVLQRGHRYQLTLTLRALDHESAREIAGATCEAVTEAAAVVIAFAVQRVAEQGSSPDAVIPEDAWWRPAVLGATPETPRAIVAEPSPAPESDPDHEAAEAPNAVGDTPRPDSPSGVAPDAETTRVRLGIEAGPSLAIGTLPEVSPGALVRASAEVLFLRVEIAGIFYAEVGRAVSEGSTVAVVGGLLGGNAGLCAGGELAILSLYGCGVLEVGRARTTAVGVPDARALDDVWTAAGLGARALLPTDFPLGAGVSVDALIPFNRRQYVIPPLGTVHQADPVVLRIHVTLEAHLDLFSVTRRF